MRIVIDMQGLQTPSSKNRGVGRYTEMLVKSLIAEATPKHEIYLVLNGCFTDEAIRLLNYFSSFLPRENIRCWQQYLKPVSGLSGNDLGRYISEIVREYFIESLNPDIIWSTNLQEGWHDDAVTSVKRINSKAIQVSTLHDVIPLLYPETHLASKIEPWYMEKIGYAKRSDAILTVSDFSKEKIVELLELDRDKIHVVHNAVCNDTFYPREDDKSLANNPYILYVGGGDEHKNLNALILAYEQMPPNVKSNFYLRFVGAGLRETITSKARILGVDVERFRFSDYVSDNELASIYRQASLFVYPSLSEGFGIPPLEAMACGTAVIASNAASLREIIGSDSALFDPTNTAELSNLMVEALTNQQFKSLLISNGLLQAKKFSWRLSAKKILRIFEFISSSESIDVIDEEPIYSRLISDLSKISNIDKTNLSALARSISESGLATGGERHKVKLFLDLSCLVHFDHATGIQRVVRAIADELRKIDSTLFELRTIFSYAGHANFYNAQFLNGKYIIPSEESLLDNVVEFNAGDTLIFLDLHPGSAISKESTINRLRLIGVKVFFVVYDLLPLEFPDYFVEELSTEFKYWLRVVALSDGVLCISRNVRDKYLQWTKDNCIQLPKSFGLNYFHLGADISNSMPSKGLPDTAAKFLEIIENAPTFLMVGTVEPRKGHKFVLDAFEEMWQNGSESILVIVGKPGWRNDETIHRLKLHRHNGSKLFWWDNASDELLELIYKNSTCLIAASEGEGFGLPLIEAAQHKIPIIARDIPVFREVAGDNASYFNGMETRNLVNAVENWLKQHKESLHPKSEDISWLTWGQSAQQLLVAVNLHQGIV